MVLFFAALYLGFLIFAVFLSDGMIFLPRPSSYRDSPEIIRIPTANGNRISAVFAFDYEGYGTSEGKPSEKAAYQDEAAAYDYLAVNLGTPPDRIVIFGRSVGTGPATYIAARRPAAGLILRSPFVSA